VAGIPLQPLRGQPRSSAVFGAGETVVFLTLVAAAWSRTPRFIRNALISLPTFLLDLGLLVLLVQRLHTDYRLATLLAFLLANGLSYLLARRLVFAGTRRSVKSGLVYFLAIAAAAALALTPMMWLLVGVFHIEFILSRIVAAVLLGIGGYLLNLTVNFRVAGVASSAAQGPPPRRSRAPDRPNMPSTSQ
jgi:putative flippase GtrA